MTLTEKRKGFLINAAYYALIIGLFYLFMKYAFWLFFPFLLAFFIAILIQRPANFIVSKTPLKKGFVSVLLVFVILAVLAVIVSLIGVRVVSEFRGLLSYLTSLSGKIPELLEDLRAWLLNAIHFLPDGIEETLGASITSFFEKLLSSSDPATVPPASGSGSSFDFSFLQAPLSGIWSTAKQIPTMFVAFIITIIATCFMSSDYDNMVLFIKRQMPPSKKGALSTSKRILFSSLGKLIKSYIIIIFITFAEMVIGLNVLKIIGVYNSGYIIAICLIVALVDILPVLGTGTIMIPWALYSLFTGNYGLGIGLLIIYAVISVIRQIVEPKLVASNLGLPPIATIASMYIGLQIFGFIGMFLMPITLVFLKLLNDEGIITIWRKEPKSFEEEPPQQAAVSVAEEQKTDSGL